jgi:hypothetical protein
MKLSGVGMFCSRMKKWRKRKVEIMGELECNVVI